MDADEGFRAYAFDKGGGHSEPPAPRDPLLAEAVAVAFRTFEVLVGHRPNGTRSEAEVFSDFLCQSDEWREFVNRDTTVG